MKSHIRRDQLSFCLCSLQVGLPGGKKEESNLAIIIGAAAGGVLFLLVLLFLLCCCCCKRKIKQHSSTPSSASSRTPERHGSLIGFSDSNSNQKLIQQVPDFNAAIAGSAASPTSASPTVSSSATSIHSMHNSEAVMLARQHPTSKHQRNLAPVEMELEIRAMNSGVTNTVLYPPQPPRPKAMMVSSNGGNGGQFHSGLADLDHYPDLLHIPGRPGPTHLSPTSTTSNSTTNSSSSKTHQPLNPAALVVPAAAPPQFPHQFPHLIHSSRQSATSTLPHPSKAGGGHHTCANDQHKVISPPHMILSPPAQFGPDDQHLSQGRPPQTTGISSYVTLPRQRPLQPRGSGQHVNWDSLASTSTTQTNNPIYDGVGPRTSATGSTQPPPGRSIQFNLSQPQQRCTTIPEEPAVKSTRSKSSPQILVLQPSERDSSGSEVTLGEDNFSSYCEPFGKAVVPPLMTSSTGKASKKRESIASSVDSDMDGLLGGGCPFHMGGNAAAAAAPKPEVKQLKGILKGGSLNKGSAMVRTKSYESAKVTPPDIASTSPAKAKNPTRSSTKALDV